jgi:cytochrome P450
MGHRPFAQIGSDVFLLVSPTKINAFVANAEVITQITTRRNDFPKPLEMYKRIDIYGKNMLSTEGSAWRTHRRVTAPSFGEKNNELVFTEALHHAQELLRFWMGPGLKGNVTIEDPGQDMARFALYIISRAGFDVRVAWPHEEQRLSQGDEKEKALAVGSVPPPGHKMNYREAMSTLLENILWTQIAPAQFLEKSPFKSHRKLGTAIQEWGQYMREMLEAKKKEVASGQDKAGMDLFHSLIRGSGLLDPNKQPELGESDVMGNAFVIMLAGHETTANALHFSLIQLALNWPSQKRLQEDIDKVLEGKPISGWTYEEDFPKLFDGMAAAVMNETLRLLQPIINIPKSTAPGRPQEFVMDGKQYTMPGGVHIGLSASVHRNPRYWPSAPDDPSSNSTSNSITQGRADIDRWRPERWLAASKQAQISEETPSDDEGLRGPSGGDTSEHLLKPVKGSYIPFSDGFRSCIGRRFAQVEILVLFAVFFSQCSVELAVDDFASDEEVERMPVGGEERRAVWEKAARRADHLLHQRMVSVITLQLREGSIPIRMVRRGEERFVFD